MPQACGMAPSAAMKSSSIGIALAVDAGLLGHLLFEAQTLHRRVCQFAEAVGELDATGV